MDETAKEKSNKCLTRQQLDFFKELKTKYNFQGFIHTTSFENFIKIMKCGYIYSRKYINNNQVCHNDIALKDVIETTEEEIKEYVRFYWRVKTPTNYDNEGIKPKSALIDNYEAHSPNPVILVFKNEIILNNNVKFTPINARSIHSKLYENCQNNYIFKWDYIFHNTPIYQEEDKTSIIRSRNAEILYPKLISTDFIYRIIFRSKADYDRANFYLGNDKRFCIDCTQFFENWLYLKDYKIKTSPQYINIQFQYSFGNEFKTRYNCNLGEYSHEIAFFDKNNNCIYRLNINELIVKNPTIEIINNYNYKILCYYIDKIECIRTKIND